VSVKLNGALNKANKLKTLVICIMQAEIISIIYVCTLYIVHKCYLIDKRKLILHTRNIMSQALRKMYVSTQHSDKVSKEIIHTKIKLHPSASW